MDIGKRIQRARKQAGLTQKQLAEQVGIATGTLQQYELGKREPRFEQLTKIANVLNTDEADFYGKDAWLLIIQGHADVHHTYSQMGYSFTQEEKELVRIFSQLNRSGKNTALERIRELTELSKYVIKED